LTSPLPAQARPAAFGRQLSHDDLLARVQVDQGGFRSPRSLIHVTVLLAWPRLPLRPATEFGATEDSAIYGTASYAFALSDTLSLTPQVGLSTGDGIETALGGVDDSYIDYSLTLGKTLKDGFTFSLAYVANTLESDPTSADFSAYSEEGQVVVGLKKSFDL
jgi:uncharacterized protein (TIGR02001 family)